MERFIGLDAHVSSCTLAVVGPRGRKIRTDVVETSARALIAYVRMIGASSRVCLEEGTLSDWLYEVLSPHVAEVVVMGQNQRRQGHKSDAIDALELAQRLRRGDIAVHVYKAGGQYQRLRALTRTYGKLQRDQTRLKNRLMWMYHSRGIHPEGSGVYSAKSRGPWVECCPATIRPALLLQYEALDAIVPVVERCEEQLLSELQAHAIARVLMTCPGFGPKWTAQLISTVVNPYRFRTKRQLWAYSGLSIVTRSSSDWARQQGQWVRANVAQCRGLSRLHNHTLKAVFKGAAKVVSGTVKPEHPLRRYYQSLLDKGLKPNLAQLTLARKLAAIVLAMWKNNQEFDVTMI